MISWDWSEQCQLLSTARRQSSFLLYCWPPLGYCLHRSETYRCQQAWPGQTRVYIGIFTLRHDAPLLSQDAWCICFILFPSLHQYVLFHAFTAKHLTWLDNRGQHQQFALSMNNRLRLDLWALPSIHMLGTCLSVGSHTQRQVYMYMYMCIYIYMPVCIYIYIYVISIYV